MWGGAEPTPEADRNEAQTRNEGEGGHREEQASSDAGDFRESGLATATIIYNRNAGGGGPEPQELEELLAEAGYEATWRETASPEELTPVLAQTTGLVVAAGGDGTFRELARRTMKRGRPLAILPMGTANNVARSLGIVGSVAEVAAGLARPRRVHFDLARARGPWGQELVAEGAGIGAFANVLASYQPDEGKNMMRAVRAALDQLDVGSPVRCRLEVDGTSLDDEYLMLEVMNTRAVGPRLAFSPTADPTDGLLDVVLVRHENHAALLAYLRALLTGELAELQSVEVVRGSTISVNWRGSAFHVDGMPYCQQDSASGKTYSAQIEAVPGAVEVWLPESDQE